MNSLTDWERELALLENKSKDPWCDRRAGSVWNLLLRGTSSF